MRLKDAQTPFPENVEFEWDVGKRINAFHNSLIHQRFAGLLVLSSADSHKFQREIIPRIELGQ